MPAKIMPVDGTDKCAAESVGVETWPCELDPFCLVARTMRGIAPTTFDRL